MPVYNAELAPKALRGRLVSLNQLAITAGIMVRLLGRSHISYTHISLKHSPLGKLPHKLGVCHFLCWLESVTGYPMYLWFHPNHWHVLPARDTKVGSQIDLIVTRHHHDDEWFVLIDGW